MNRRYTMRFLSLFGLGLGARSGHAAPPAPGAQAGTPAAAPAVRMTDAEWQQRLPAAAYRVLRQESTEAPGSSLLNREKRRGTYHCAGCDAPLFSSEAKYESGTGWPSFHTPLPAALGTKTDFKLILPRTEYHCARCGGHQGHVFDDGPRPSGKRYCNNGVALKFAPAAA